jgi:hypothetical protein
MWFRSGISAAACVLAVTLAAPADASQGRGKAKGHEKQAQKGKPGKPDQDRPVGTSGVGMRFKGLDYNNDGIISREEWKGSSKAFAVHDWNGDGRLSGDEVRPGATKPEPGHVGDEHDAALFRGLDRDRNGVLTRAEWRGDRAEFARLDLDRNGVLTPYEFGVGR